MLELIAVLCKKGRNINIRKVAVAIDNRKVRNSLINAILKASYCPQDAGEQIAQMRRLLNEVSFEIEFKLVKIIKNAVSWFSSNLLDYLLIICNKKVQ